MNQQCDWGWHTHRFRFVVTLYGRLLAQILYEKLGKVFRQSQQNAVIHIGVLLIGIFA